MEDVADGAVAALDVGGTSIKAGLVAADGTVTQEMRRPTGVAGGVDAVVDGIGILTEQLIAAGGPRVRAVGLGVPGIVESDAGIARYAANLGWRDLPIAAILSRRVGLPVALGHDVRNGALGEARLGAGAHFGGSIYFIAIGTGIASGLVRDGAVDEGATGQAGEVGHLVVRPGGPLCGCGNHGCLEAIASASRIENAYAARTGARATAKDIVTLVREGDFDADAVWTEAIAALADALASVVVLTDPGLVVIGGGLSLAGPILVEPLVTELTGRLTFRRPPPVVLTELGDRAGLLGAALRAWDLLAAQDERGSNGEM